jgi:tRNA nucleotidyltransferase (CCA-adding enzyme)
MVEEAKVVLQLLNKRGFEAFYIGGKCRTDLDNLYHRSEKKMVHDVDIVTNAAPDEIKKIFPQHKEQGIAFSVVVIKFAECSFEIATYRKDNYDMAKVKRSSKIVKPTVVVAGTLDEDRARRDFTINTVAQDVNGKYIDYTYSYKKKTISAMGDIDKKIIRCVGDPVIRFEEDPLRIMRMFRFMSTLSYDIEKQTLKAAVANKKLLEKIPAARFTYEMNKLLTGENVKATLSLMKKSGIFNIRVDGEPFLPSINNMDDEEFNILNKYNSHASDNFVSYIELWSLLFRHTPDEVARTELYAFFPITKLSIEKALWVKNHFYFITSTDLHNDIFEARTGVVKNIKQSGMRELIQHIASIHNLVNNTAESRAKAKELYDAFCEKPYFPEQLRITGDDLVKICDKKPGKWIDDVKEHILYELINAEKFPYEYDAYMDVVSKSIRAVLGADVWFTIPEEPIEIDEYGNKVDASKVERYRALRIYKEAEERIKQRKLENAPEL